MPQADAVPRSKALLTALYRLQPCIPPPPPCSNFTQVLKLIIPRHKMTSSSQKQVIWGGGSHYWLPSMCLCEAGRLPGLGM